MSILVAYASKHGATGEIAERIARGLRAGGKHAVARPVLEAGDLGDYEGFVIGSAAYSTHWLTDATAFVSHNQDLLAQRPVWLFSSGPLGGEAGDAEGVDRHVASEPREICRFQGVIHPRDHRVFFGALDPARLSLAERSCLKMAATRAILPEGDFREWAQIDQWAAGIALELTQLDALPLQGATPDAPPVGPLSEDGCLAKAQQDLAEASVETRRLRHAMPVPGYPLRDNGVRLFWHKRTWRCLERVSRVTELREDRHASHHQTDG